MDPIFFSLVTTFAHKESQRSRIRVTSDIIFPGQGPQIVAAVIGEPEPQRSRQNSFYHTCTRSVLSLGRNHAARSGIPPEFIIQQPSIAEHKVNFRRLSKMVLAGYGGASLLFFGVSPTYFSSATKNSTNSFTTSPDAMVRAKKSEETKLANAIEASEAEAAGDAENPEERKEYSWWDVLLGRHDQEIFEQSTTHHDDHKGMKATAVGYFYSGLTSTSRISYLFDR